jgi:hypothetical protein
MKGRINRRNLLRGIACGVPVAIGLPLLESFLNSNGTAFADGEALPRRFGIFFWGNGRGVEAARWNPAKSGAEWDLSPQLEPLKDYKSYLNVVSGARIRLSNSPQGHHKGSVGILSGADFVTQPAGNAPYRSTFSGPSIDQTIARAIGSQTKFPSLEIGISQRVIKGEGTTLQFLSHNGPDNTNPPEYDPVKLFDRVFAGSGGTPPTTQDPTLIKNAAEMQRSVLDSITGDLNGLRQRVGARDRARIDQHMQNIRDVERRLTATVGPGAITQAQCSSPTRPPALAKNPAGEPLEERMKAMSELIALALACDMTRVFSVMFTGSAAGPVFHQIGLDRGNHDLSHEGEAAQDAIDASMIFTMKQLGVLLGALNSATEGDSNLLKQSAILVSSDTSDGALHSVNDHPVLVAGGGGGFLKTPGVHLATKGANTSEVLLTLVRSMGIEASEFGGGDGRVTVSCTGIEA